MSNGSANTGISGNSKRIMKNTLLLYVRMFIMMFIGLFTSRIVLRSLGVTDFGIWNAVGGLTSLFAVVTAALSSSISRNITFALGEGNPDKLKSVFASSIRIQWNVALIVIVLIETLGLWFLNCKMNIPAERMGAANWVLQATMVIMVMGLISAPFTAVIIAHEDMGAFSVITVLDAILKLGVALLILNHGADRLKAYSVLIAAASLTIRLVYSIYSRRHYPECKGKMSYDKQTVKSMVGFAGWNFLGPAAYLINTHGINILSNLFFGVGINAVRGIATKAESVVMQFVNNFTTALNPQITKSYAEGNRDYCYHLVCRGAKYTYLLMLAFAIPVYFEAELLLRLWLGPGVPESAPLFTRLGLIAIMADLLGNSLAQLELATGDIKKYYLIIGPTTLLVFFISWFLFHIGYPPQTSYYVFICVYTLLVGVKLAIIHGQIGFPVMKFVNEVLLRVAAVTVFAFLCTWGARSLVATPVWRLLATLGVSTAAIAAGAFLFAFTKGETAFFMKFLRRS